MSDDLCKLTGTVELKGFFEYLLDLPEKDVKSNLRYCAKNAAPEVLTDHYERHKGEWPAPLESYAKRSDKKGKDQLVHTGEMMRGIKNKKAPNSLRRITVAKLKKRNVYRISISLRKMVNGQNVYTFAQMGRAKGATVTGRYGFRRNISMRKLNDENQKLNSAYKQARKNGFKGKRRDFESQHRMAVTVNRVGKRVVCQSEPTDVQFFNDRIQAAFQKYLARKAKQKAKKQ